MFETFLQLSFLLFLVDVKVYIFCFSCRGKEAGIMMAPGGKGWGGEREGGSMNVFVKEMSDDKENSV